MNIKSATGYAASKLPIRAGEKRPVPSVGEKRLPAKHSRLAPAELALSTRTAQPDVHRQSKGKIPDVKADSLLPLLPVNWRSIAYLVRDKNNHLTYPPEWKKWLMVHPPDTPLSALPELPQPELMSSRLWPVINQLLIVIDSLEQQGYTNHSVTVNVITVTWIELFPTLSHKIEVKVMLNLCRIAMANDSPLTETQKRFLLTFIFVRKMQKQHKTCFDIYNLVQEMIIPIPNIKINTLPPACITASQLHERGRNLFKKRLVIHQ